MTTSAVLSEFELDALTELVNIGVSRAAGSLRKMVGQQVLLSVPSVGHSGRVLSRSSKIMLWLHPPMPIAAMPLLFPALLNGLVIERCLR